MCLGLIGGGEEEAVCHLVKGGAAWVFHPNNTTLVLVDTMDSAHFHAPAVGDVDYPPNDWVVGLPYGMHPDGRD